MNTFFIQISIEDEKMIGTIGSQAKEEQNIAAGYGKCQWSGFDLKSEFTYFSVILTISGSFPITSVTGNNSVHSVPRKQSVNSSLIKYIDSPCTGCNYLY